MQRLAQGSTIRTSDEPGNLLLLYYPGTLGQSGRVLHRKKKARDTLLPFSPQEGWTPEENSQGVCENYDRRRKRGKYCWTGTLGQRRSMDKRFEKEDKEAGQRRKRTRTPSRGGPELSKAWKRNQRVGAQQKEIAEGERNRYPGRGGRGGDLLKPT